MLQIKNVSKKYVTGDFTQMALNDVSLNLRDNEFVAVLGPSGSGKTTLLNVIGGLDRYDEGDLVINGISTKEYTDRDWDSYRNHTIGFVFQSYNLIPQQNILSNVEIALTISGVSRDERRKRAKEALEQVGLGDQIHKKPNQLSGGQMQRVAIARALINNPDILLADEPTGALDTETSVQVMDLLKEVAKDRMVVMVTHNPELANEYATRIVRLQDGRIIDDSDPYVVDETEMAEPVHQNMGYSSMSLPTSIGLSGNNLIAKRGRTLLTCIAGAIGIIAIALILSVSAGVNNYIDALEEDTMAEYPVEVTASGFDISNMMATMMGTVEQIVDAEDADDGFTVMTMISRMVNVIMTNELGPFKEYLESGETDIDEYAKAIEYIYDVEPQIYLEDGADYHQVNPESTLTSGFGLSESLTSMMSSMLTMLSTFFQLPENEDLYIDSYDVMAGRWPEAYNECVLVMSSMGSVADYMIYTLGLEDFNEYEALVEEAMDGGEIPDVEYDSVYYYDDVVGTTYKLVNAADYYEYDEEYEVWTDKRDNETYMRQLVANGEDLTIVGVVRAREDATTAILNDGINYPASLIEHVAEVAAESDVVKDQLANPDVNVLTGEEFGAEFALDLTSMFDMDEDMMNELFNVDELMDAMDFSSIDLSGLDLSGMDLSGMDMDMDMSSMFAGMDMSMLIDPSSADLAQISNMLMAGYNDYVTTYGISSYADLQDDFTGYLTSSEGQSILSDALTEIVENSVTASSVSDLLSDLQSASDPTTAFTEWIADLWSSTTVDVDDIASSLMEGYEAYAESGNGTSADSVSNGLNAYLSSEMGIQQLTQAMMGMLSMDALEQMLTASMGQMTESMMSSMMTSLTSQIETSLSDAMSGMMESMADSFEFDIDPESIMESLSTDMDQDSLLEMMTSMSSAVGSSYDGVLADLGYLDYANPIEIDIYPKDFDSKDGITAIIDDYNTMVLDAGEEEKEISYTDIMGTMMSTVSTIINLVTYVLIAFVSISLVVSAIMIGIITYISVLERTREIGILRALGASKRNVGRIFNVETFIVGLISGIIGVVVGLLLLIPINAIVHNFVQDDSVRAFLPAGYGILLIVLAVVLTLIGGIIPSRKASKMDPVAALRSE